MTDACPLHESRTDTTIYTVIRTDPGTGYRSAGSTEATGTDRSASDNRGSRAVDARLKEQQVILLEVIVVHTVGRLLARIPDTSEGIW